MTNPLSSARPGRYFSRAFEKEAVAYNQPCVFRVAVMTNNGAGPLWLCVADSRDNNAKVPHLAPVLVPNGSTGSLDWSMAARDMRDGIYVYASTDPTNKALPGTNDVFFEVAYDLPYPA
jgi:hypothetical protein